MQLERKWFGAYERRIKPYKKGNLSRNCEKRSCYNNVMISLLSIV